MKAAVVFLLCLSALTLLVAHAAKDSAEDLIRDVSKDLGEEVVQDQALVQDAAKPHTKKAHSKKSHWKKPAVVDPSLDKEYDRQINKLIHDVDLLPARTSSPRRFVSGDTNIEEIRAELKLARSRMYQVINELMACKDQSKDLETLKADLKDARDRLLRTVTEMTACQQSALKNCKKHAGPGQQPAELVLHPTTHRHIPKPHAPVTAEPPRQPGQVVRDTPCVMKKFVGKCDKKCGGGRRIVGMMIAKPGTGRARCPMSRPTMQPCNTQACPTAEPSRQPSRVHDPKGSKGPKSPALVPTAEPSPSRQPSRVHGLVKPARAGGPKGPKKQPKVLRPDRKSVV